MKAINKAIDINASKEKVWKVLTDDAMMRDWYACFNPSAYAEMKLEIGAKAKFLDNNNNGMVGKIAELEPNKILSFEMLGNIKNGEEDYDSAEVKEWQGGRETYRLSEKDGVTKLETETAMVDSYYEMMSAMWDKAMLRIKELAES